MKLAHSLHACGFIGNPVFLAMHLFGHICFFHMHGVMHLPQAIPIQIEIQCSFSGVTMLFSCRYHTGQYLHTFPI